MQNAFMPNVGELSREDGWISVHDHLPLDCRATLLVVYQDLHGAGVTSACCERGRFLNSANRALVRGVKAWRYQ
ncbi:hypothetical protein [Halomonas elongata]|uniref:hypothetical protein n=1 Tax=Halomonas elongata TaxID=2746 RepID=UPI0023B0613D|nr:hypothetical protein [Halomonas elongata]